jgi:hypothetical protein
MKSRVLLVLALILATVPAVLGADKSETKKSITLGEPALVGSTTLKPGDYKVEWTGVGPNVTVNFVQGKNVIASAPATLQTKNSNTTSIFMKDEGNGNKSVTEIDWSHTALMFQPGAQSNTNTPSTTSR